jgi:hypothetical protein
VRTNPGREAPQALDLWGKIGGLERMFCRARAQGNQSREAAVCMRCQLTVQGCLGWGDGAVAHGARSSDQTVESAVGALLRFVRCELVFSPECEEG